jgi:hypothetical protein
MPALCAISLPVLADLSKNARRLRKGQSQSLTRIARCLRPYIPTGFVPEFETLAKVTHNFDLPSIERQSLAETSAQILYLLGLLLALQADNVELRRSEDTTAATAHLTTPSSNWLKRVLGAANLTDTAGFVRGFDDGRPTVTLRPAKAA